MATSFNKIMPKIQKHVIRAAFALCVLFFVYSLIFSTDIYPLMQHSDPMSGFYVPGAEMYYDAQNFNKLLLILSVVLLVFSLTLLVYFSQKRRLYYTGNYISCSIFTVLATALSVYVLINVIILRGMYVRIDFEAYKTAVEITNARYVKSTFFFDIGIILCLLMIITCALIICLLVYKYRLKKSERNAAKTAGQIEEQNRGTDISTEQKTETGALPEAKNATAGQTIQISGQTAGEA